MTEHDSLSAAIQESHELLARLGTSLDAFGHDPMSGSVASNELTTHFADHAKSAYAQGTALIEIAADQLSGLIRAFVEPVLTLAPWTNARAVLEATSISLWLLDNSIDVSERVRRSYAFRCEGLNQQVKFLRSAKLPQLTDAEARLSNVLDQARREGIETTLNEAGKSIDLSRPMPSITDLVRDQLDDEPSYRLFSAVTHQHLWAIQQLGFKTIQNASGVFLQKSVRFSSILYLFNVTLRALRKPLECKCRIFGWPVSGIGMMFEHTLLKLSSLSVQSDEVLQSDKPGPA